MLGKSGEPGAVEPLIQALRETNKHIRKAAIIALGQLGEPRAIEPLITILGDPDRRVNLAAIAALTVFEKREANSVVSRLLSAISDTDKDSRRRAADALSRLGEPKWSQWVKGDSEDFARLGKSGDPHAVEPLIQVLREGNSTDRRAAASALGILGAPSAIEPLLISAVSDKDARRSAGEAVLHRIQLKDARAVGPLIKALSHENWSVRALAAAALGLLGDVRAVEPLIQLLEFPPTREAAATALGQLGDVRAVEPLIQLLRNGHKIGRQSAAKALGRLGDSRAIQPLINAQEGASWDFIRVALEALCNIGAGSDGSNTAKAEQADVREQPKAQDSQQLVEKLRTSDWEKVIGTITLPIDNDKTFVIEASTGQFEIACNRFVKVTDGVSARYYIGADTIDEAKKIRELYFPPRHAIPRLTYFEVWTTNGDIIARDCETDYEDLNPEPPQKASESASDNAKVGETDRLGWRGGDYSGSTLNGMPHGKGKLTYPDGAVYIGEFSHGEFSGKGKSLMPDGRVYEGEFSAGGANGQGVYTWPNGRKYVGAFQNDKMHGHGVWTSPEGIKFTGEFRDDKMHKGTTEYPDGARYVGEFKNDVIEGRGTFTYPDGSRYEGEFRDWARHGRGKFTAADGRVQEGRWENNAFVGRP